MKENNCCEGLKSSGLKNTKQRLALLDILQQSDQPISAEQVYLKLKEKNISIHLSTVYRTLETLAAKNLINKLNLSCNSVALFEYNRMDHRHYLVCMGCNKILPIEHCPLVDYEKTLAKNTKFDVIGHKLDIYGYCPKCKKLLSDS